MNGNQSIRDRGNTVYVGRYFLGIGGGLASNFAAINASDGLPAP